MNEVIIIALIIFLIFSFSYIQNKRFQYKLRTLNESRPDLDRAEYVNILVQKGFDKLHAEVVHDKIREFAQMDDFSIYPEDDLPNLYRMDDMDIMEMVDKICKALHLRRAEEVDFNELNEKIKVVNAEYILMLTKKLAA